MLKKQLIFIVISCFYLPSFGQLDSLVDKRDGRKYAVVQIGEKRWFKDFLKYQTALSHCPNFNKKEGDCNVGNYYSYLELDTICPEGWHVATTKNWEAYFDYLQEVKAVDNRDLEIAHTKPNMPNLGFMVTDTTDEIHLFQPPNPLNLSPLGWVQGRKLQVFGTLTMWINKEDSDDGKYHLHIGPNRYIEHTHQHHIIDKPRKKRKFVVKCVCDEDKNK